MLLSVRVQFVSIVFEKGQAKPVNGTQRSPQIVRNAITKALQFFVHHSEFGVAYLKVLIQPKDVVFCSLVFRDVADGTRNQQAFIGLQRTETDLYRKFR